MASLKGTEVLGSPKVNVQATVGSYTRDVPFRVHMLNPSSLTIRTSLTQVRPIAGWYDSSDSSCTKLMFQTGTVAVTADFSDSSSDKLPTLDVSSIVNIVSSNTKAVALKRTASGVTFTGVSAGLSTLAIKLANSFAVDQNAAVTTLPQVAEHMIAVVGIDAIALTSLGGISVSPASPYDRGTKVAVTLGKPIQPQFNLQGDKATIVASAVLEDHTRIFLTPANGLVLSANAPSSLKVSGETVYVPYDPKPAAGPLIQVSWNPQGKCQSKNNYQLSRYVHQNLTLAVEPPQAKAMVAGNNHRFLVCTGDAAAASGADFPSNDQIKVVLQYPLEQKY